MTKNKFPEKESKEEILSFLTTEPLSKRFHSLFDLVNYSVELAKQALDTKRPSMLHQVVPNLSQQILLEIVNEQDLLIDAALETAKREKAVREEAEALRIQQEAAEAAVVAEKSHAKQRTEKRQHARAAKALLPADA